MKLKRMLFAILGCVSLGLGCIGIVLPLLPTVPFLLLTGFCFANSSEKLDRWFKGTKLYKKHLESYVKKEGMLLQTKLTIMISATILMSIGFILMDSVPIGRIVLAVIWVGHLFYFLFRVKTIPASRTADAE